MSKLQKAAIEFMIYLTIFSVLGIIVAGNVPFYVMLPINALAAVFVFVFVRVFVDTIS